MRYFTAQNSSAKRVEAISQKTLWKGTASAVPKGPQNVGL
jgi:hypothetical protein